MSRKILIKIALWIIRKDVTLHAERKNQVIMLAHLHQNNGFQQYLSDREQELVWDGMARYAKGKLNDSRVFQGQLYEVQRLRLYVKACYNIHKKELAEKKEENLTRSVGRRHSR